MKKRIFALAVTLFASTLLLAQAPPTPPGNPGSGNTPVGGGAAPLVGGVALLAGMAMGYGAMKLCCFKERTQSFNQLNINNQENDTF